MSAPRYRVTGTLIPVLATEESDQAIIAASPLAVDIVLRSTDPAFPARATLWVVALGYAAWRWESPPTVERLEEETDDLVRGLEDAVPEWLRALQGGG